MNIADVAFGLGSQPLSQPGGSVAAGFFAALEAAMAPGGAGLPVASGDGASTVPAAAGSATANSKDAAAPNVPQVLAMLGTADAKPTIAAPGTVPATPASAAAIPTAAASIEVAPPQTALSADVPNIAAAPQAAETRLASATPAEKAPEIPEFASNPGADLAPSAATPGRTAGRVAPTDSDGLERDQRTPEPAASAAAPRGAKSARPAKLTATPAPAALDQRATADESADAGATPVDAGDPQAGADKKQVQAEATPTAPDAQPQPQPSASAASAEATMLAVAASAVVPVAAAPQQQSKPASPAAGLRAGAVRAPRANGTTDAVTAQTGDTAPSRGSASSARAAAPKFQSELADDESETNDAPAQKLAALGETAKSASAPLPAAVETPRAHAPAAAAPTSPASAAEPSISARHGEIGRALGIEVARRVLEGGEELRVRLNPGEFGRVEVNIAFDDSGTLRATVHAENPAALDILRRDSADLGQAMGDAGVRADAQSFRFESRADGQQRQQQQAQRQFEPSGSTTPFMDDPLPEAALAAYRPVRTPGRVDLLA